jgi:GMP synthase-like glutamine amidotransferase
MKLSLSTGVGSYSNLFPSFEIVVNPTKADLIIFTGGADVSPDLYWEASHPATMNDPWRDVHELGLMRLAIQKGIPILGICRGAQLATIVAGGTLIQHVNNHILPGTHPIHFKDGSPPIEMTSTHHQMMNPYPLPKEEYEILAASNKLSKIYQTGGERQFHMPVEPEIIYYPLIKTLAIQGHPERLIENHKTYDKFKQLVCKYLFDGRTDIFSSKRTRRKRMGKQVQGQI